jgi:amino acid transporter
VDLFGIDADHRGGRRRWTTVAWPLLGGLVGVLLGVLIAPPLVALLPADVPPWLLPAAVIASAGGFLIAFMVAARICRRAGAHDPHASRRPAAPDR